MGEVVNLRQARKAKARVAADTQAAANRAAFGRTKAAKAADALVAARHETALDGARLDEPAPPRERR